MYDNWSAADLREEISRLMELAQHEHTRFVQMSSFGGEQSKLQANRHQEEAQRLRIMVDHIEMTLKSKEA